MPPTHIGLLYHLVLLVSLCQQRHSVHRQLTIRQTPPTRARLPFFFSHLVFFCLLSLLVNAPELHTFFIPPFSLLVSVFVLFSSQKPEADALKVRVSVFFWGGGVEEVQFHLFLYYWVATSRLPKSPGLPGFFGKKDLITLVHA